jgi:hypothetical protein
MDTEALFVATLDWLHRASTRDPLDAYEMVLTSGRLRLLLLDGAPLVHTVNRERRLKLAFDVGDHSPPPAPLPQPLFWAVPDGLNPNHMTTTHNVPMLSLSLDEFLARRILVYEGVDVKVKELIRHAAHVSGGVHAGEPEDGMISCHAWDAVQRGLDRRAGGSGRVKCAASSCPGEAEEHYDST